MKIAFWIALLIGLYLIIAYYKGSVGILNAFSNFVSRLVLFLQGRNDNGNVNNYPQDASNTGR